MKKIFTYFGIFLSVVLMGSLSSCQTKELEQTADLGLGIKVFSPTKVVKGQPMTINGSGFGDVKEIIFPNDVSVTDFEIVSNEMIRVVAPSGISAEGGKLIVRTDEEQVESPLPLTLGNTSVSGYSKLDGEEVEGGEQITIFGKDLEFINAVELLDADSVANVISHSDFYRKGTSSVIFYVPRKNIFEGTFKGKVYTYDGKTFEMPELSYKPKQDAGHWEIQKTILWENDGTPIPSWGGTFRFSSAERSTGEEIYAFPMEDWAAIKEGVVRVAVDVNESSNIRITTGWWGDAYGGFEHNCIDFVQEDEDGTKYIELNIKEEGTLYDQIDEKHLLFTGDQYTILYIYTQEEVWVEGEAGHWERKSFWKNEDGTPIPSWGGTFRFSSAERSTGEEIYAFPMEDWAVIKEGAVRVAVDVNESSNIRITTGWWGDAYGGFEHNCIDMVQEDENGTKYIELNIKGEGTLYDQIDEKHLLFTGDAYTLLEIYVETWVEGGEVDPEIDLKDFITYEQPDPAFSYPYYPSWGDNTGKLRIKRDNGLKELGLQAGKSKFIFYKTPGTTGQIQINNPNWTQLTTVADWNGDLEILEYVLDEDAIKCVTGEISDGWSETAIILQGDGLEVTKMTVLP